MKKVSGVLHAKMISNPVTTTKEEPKWQVI